MPPEVFTDCPQDLGVRVHHAGQIFYGCVGARRQRDGVWEAWVHQIMDADGKPSARSDWYPYSELEPLLARKPHHVTEAATRQPGRCWPA